MEEQASSDDCYFDLMKRLDFEKQPKSRCNSVDGELSCSQKMSSEKSQLMVGRNVRGTKKKTMMMNSSQENCGVWPFLL